MSAPESGVALARHRMDARVVKDFALADTLRAEIAPHINNLDGKEDYRQLQSTKNYHRILERFKGKSAILSPRR